MKSFQTTRLSFTPVSLSDTVALHELRSEPEVMKWSTQKHPDTCLQDTEDWIRKATPLTDNMPPPPPPPPPPSASNRTRLLMTRGKAQAQFRTQAPKKGIVFCVRELSHLTAMQEGKAHKDRVVGIVGIREAESLFSKAMQYELGYMFVPGVWGRGYASEAVKGILGWWVGNLRELDALEGSGGKGEKANEGEVADEERVYAVVAKANGPSMRVMEKAGFWKVNEGVDSYDGSTELVEFCISLSAL